MAHYDTFDPTPYRTHMRTLGWLRPGDRVLEVGSSSGALSERIRAMGCEVVGIERREDAAEKARRFCKTILVGDVERMNLDIPESSMDVILVLDVLEHLVGPEATLRRLLPFLKSTGRVIVALPNIAHWSVRMGILLGRFDYEDSGIMDRTHLHFYTWKTARTWLEGAGLEVIESDVVPDVPLLRYKRRLERLNYKVARLLPNLLSTESLFVARPRQEPSSP